MSLSERVQTKGDRVVEFDRETRVWFLCSPSHRPLGSVKPLPVFYTANKLAWASVCILVFMNLQRPDSGTCSKLLYELREEFPTSITATYWATKYIPQPTTRGSTTAGLAHESQRFEFSESLYHVLPSENRLYLYWVNRNAVVWNFLFWEFTVCLVHLGRGERVRGDLNMGI